MHVGRFRDNRKKRNAKFTSEQLPPFYSLKTCANFLRQQNRIVRPFVGILA
jgi:hypothetical protein